MEHNTEQERSEFDQYWEELIAYYRAGGWEHAKAFVAEKWQAARRAPVVPSEQQILDAAEKAGLWPNTVHTWIPAFKRYHEALSAAPKPPETENLERSMAMLIRQLASILRSKDPESSAVKNAIAFLNNHGLMGSPLRADVPENASTGAAFTSVGTLCASDEQKSVPEAYKAVCKCGAITGALISEYFSQRELEYELGLMAAGVAALVPIEKLGNDPLTVEICKCATIAAQAKQGESKQ